MSDAIGGTVNVMLVAIFMVIVSGYMAFNVSYVKAFKVKNRIIDLVEQYEGNCNPTVKNKCTQKIEEYMTEIGYNTPVGANTGKWCSESAGLSTAAATGSAATSAGGCCDRNRGYCIGEVRVQNKKVSGGKLVGDTKSYYRFLTHVNIDIPIVNKIMPNMKVFQVTGETKVIKTAG